jgi:hypothetical protein
MLMLTDKSCVLVEEPWLMFRFTIRDLLWLMMVVGLVCGWLGTEDNYREFRREAEARQSKLYARIAKEEHDKIVARKIADRESYRAELFNDLLHVDPTTNKSPPDDPNP